METPPSIGWTHSSMPQRVPRAGPADIQSLMMPSSSGEHTPQRTILDASGGMKSESMELKTDMFLTNRQKRTGTGTATPPTRHEMTTEGLKIDMIPVEETPHRSLSAKHPPHNLLVLTNQMPEFSASAKHLGEPINGLKPKPIAAHRDLPSLKVIFN